MKIINKILVPTDFSDLSLAGMEYVATLGVLHDAKIYVLHVVPDNILAPPFPNVDMNSETIMRDTVEKAREELQHFISEHLKNLGKVTQAVRRGEPAKEIIRFAEEEDIGLIVMATHGRTGVAHVLMGSVAEKVVRHSTIPVLTVKPVSLKNTILEEADVKEQLHLSQCDISRQ